MTQSNTPIDNRMIVEDVIDQFPATSRVFIRRRMLCVGCPIARFETVEDVCSIYRVPLGDLLTELNHAASTSAS